MRNWKFNHIDFSTYPDYDANDLGVFWYPEKTVIKIWAPTAKIVEFRLFKDGISGEAYHKTNLQQLEKGIWSTVLTGDYEGKYYTFRVNDGEWLNEVPDMYCRCVGVNGLRGMIYNPNKTNPENWIEDNGLRFKSFTEAIIYETHVRDFSIDENSGIEYKGKYLGFAEKGTKSTEGLKTGLDHLKELGVTHVHLLPVNDFATIDEMKIAGKYNWGYDPLHYNALEGSFSNDPYDGTKRILEFKKLVKSLHDSGIGVILDVVYNHTYFTEESVFNQFVPGYFYRQKEDGTFSNASGCGNEIASERSMVRKYIIDSIKYWVEEYHVDGFRFDLMGILDVKTMKSIRKELNRFAPEIFLYGEGWAADHSPMSENDRAIKRNILKIPGIGCFNDDFRDAIKGNHGIKKSKGFASGLVLREEAIKFGITAAVNHPQINYDFIESVPAAWALEPDQCINYASSHDNYTLWDKLKQSLPRTKDEEMRSRVKLAGALVLTSQGVPFLHSGMEFCRTKKGNGNSYKSPDSVNKLDWSLKKTYFDVFQYFQKLIQLRKNHPAFRMPLAEQIRKNLNFCTQYQVGVVSYCLDGKSVGDSWSQIILIFNGNNESTTIPLSEGKFKLIAKGEEISETGLGENVENETVVDPISMSILVSV